MIFSFISLVRTACVLSLLPVWSLAANAQDPSAVTPEPITKKNHPAKTARELYFQRKYKSKRKLSDGSRAQLKIVGGKNADASAYPWMVALAKKGEPDLYEGQFCGGSLIHPYWVITSANCVDGETAEGMEVVLGAYDLTQPDAIQRISVLEIIEHPDFKSNNLHSDLALLRLASPAEARFSPIPLADLSAVVEPGVSARALGWGDTSGNGNFPAVLQEVDFPIVSLDVANASPNYQNTLVPEMLPAGFVQGGKDTCQGDSGGPLMVPSAIAPGGWMLAGITSFRVGECAEAGAYGIYTRITSFRRFIFDHLYQNYSRWEVDAGVVGELRDLDGDGLNNFGEFAFRSDPLSAGPSSVELVLHHNGGERFPALRFFRRATAGEIVWDPQQSNDLSNWQSFDWAANLVEDSPVVGAPGTLQSLVASPEKVTGENRYLRMAVNSSGEFLHSVRSLSCPGRAKGALRDQDERHPVFAARFAKTYRLSGCDPGKVMTIVARSGEFDVMLELLNGATGTRMILATQDTADGVNGTDEKIAFTPLANRSYLVRVSSEGNQETGLYELGVYDRAEYTRTQGIAFPATVSGSLSLDSPLDPLWSPQQYYSSDYRVATISEPITITLSSTAFDSFLEIVNPETGLLLQSDDDSAGNLDARITFAPIPGVPFIIRVTTAEPNSTGEFALSVSEGSPPEPGVPLPVPGTTSGSLSPGDSRDPNSPGAYIDDYELTGLTVGQVVTVNMVSGAIDSYLFVVDGRTGAILGQDDDSGTGLNSRLSFQVQPGVTYLLRATSYRDREVGAYTLSTS